jgi:hypothetical protein
VISNHGKLLWSKATVLNPVDDVGHTRHSLRDGYQCCADKTPEMNFTIDNDNAAAVEACPGLLNQS